MLGFNTQFRTILRHFRPWAVLGVLVLVTLSISLWAWSRSQETEGLQVAKLYRAGQDDEAWRLVERWIARRPSSAEAWIWRTRLALATRRPAEASEGLRKAEEFRGDQPRIDLLRAIALGQSGDFARAEPVLREAFNAQGDPDPLLDETLARIYLESYDMARAGSVIIRWMRDAPGDPKPFLWRAEVDTRTGNIDRLLTDFQEALTRDPNSAPARLGLAEQLRVAHRNAEATAAFAAYLELKPDDAVGHLGAGRNAAELDETDIAFPHLEKAIAITPNDPLACRSIAELLIRKGELTAALAHLDRAVATDPFDLEVRHSRGLVLARLGRNEEAEADQAKAKQFRVELDVLLTAQAKLVRIPNDRESQVSIMTWMFAHGKAQEGERWAKNLLREVPNQPDACRLLAEYYDKSGQPGLANSYRIQGGVGTLMKHLP